MSHESGSDEWTTDEEQQPIPRGPSPPEYMPVSPLPRSRSSNNYEDEGISSPDPANDRRYFVVTEDEIDEGGWMSPAPRAAEMPAPALLRRNDNSVPPVEFRGFRQVNDDDDQAAFEFDSNVWGFDGGNESEGTVRVLRCEVNVDGKTVLKVWHRPDEEHEDTAELDTWYALRPAEREWIQTDFGLPKAYRSSLCITFALRYVKDAGAVVGMFGPPLGSAVVAEPLLFTGVHRTLDRAPCHAETGMIPQSTVSFDDGLCLCKHGKEMMATRAGVFETAGRPKVFVARSVESAARQMAAVHRANPVPTVVFTRPETMDVWRQLFPNADVVFLKTHSSDDDNIYHARTIVDDYAYWGWFGPDGTEFSWAIQYETFPALSEDFDDEHPIVVHESESPPPLWEHPIDCTGRFFNTVPYNRLQRILNRVHEVGGLQTPENYMDVRKRLLCGVRDTPTTFGKQRKVPDSCPMCLIEATDVEALAEEVPEPNGAVVLDCGHEFHASCIEQWKKSNYSARCPLCRGKLVIDTGTFWVGSKSPHPVHQWSFRMLVTIEPKPLEAPHMEHNGYFAYAGGGDTIVLDGLDPNDSIDRRAITYFGHHLLGIDVARESVKFHRMVRSAFEQHHSHYLRMP